MHTTSAGRNLAAFAAPTLILLATVAPFLRYHDYSFLLPESLALLAGCVAIGLLVGAVSRSRPHTLGLALTGLLLSLFLLCRPELQGRATQAVTDLAFRVGDVGLALGLILTALFAAACAVSWLLRRHLDRIVIAVFGTIVVSALILPFARGGDPVEAGNIPERRADLPPVIHVILDEHSGVASLPADRPGSIPARRAIFETYDDFALYTNAYSRFAETKFAITSLMNANVGRGVTDLFGGTSGHFKLKRNAWFDRLKAQGYALRVYQSSWFDMCANRELVDSCYTYPMFSISALQRSSLGSAQRLGLILEKLLLGQVARDIMPMASMDALEQFNADIEAAPRGVAFVLHLLLPHAGYLYAADCSLADPSLWAALGRGSDDIYSAEERAQTYDRYLGQLACTQKRMGEVFARLKRLGVYEDATIIVHGDHGSRIGIDPYVLGSPRALSQQTVHDHFDTLLAIKAPGVAAGVREKPATIQTVFADTFLSGSVETGDAAQEPLIRVRGGHGFQPAPIDWPAGVAPAPPAPAAARLPPDLRASLD